jgi:hypothetical protein
VNFINLFSYNIQPRDFYFKQAEKIYLIEMGQFLHAEYLEEFQDRRSAMDLQPTF